MGRLFTKARSDTERSMGGWPFWTAALLIAGPITVFVAATFPEHGLWERAGGATLGGLAAFAVLVLAWFGWNLVHAGNRLEIEAHTGAIAQLRADLSTMQAQVKPELTDEEIIATFTPRTKEMLRAFEKDFVRGWSANNVDTEVIAQLTEYDLAVITQDITPVFGGKQQMLIPHIRLTPHGLRTLRKLKGE